MAADDDQTTKAAEPPSAASKPAVVRAAGKKKAKPLPTPSGKRKSRTVRAYPAASFEDALSLAQEIIKHAPDGKIRRLTFCKLANRSATSSSTKMLITNSGKYGITKGSYAAEYLEITPDGMIAVGAQSQQGAAPGALCVSD
jgi:hypothetical protein